MTYEQVISLDEFEEEREKSDEIWSDYEVFEESRDRVPLREIVLEAVEGQYTHPNGPDTVYGLEGSSDTLAREKITHGDLVPDDLPKEVKQQFADDLAEEVSEYSTELFTEVRDNIDEDDDLSEVRNILEKHAEEMVPEEF